MIHKVIIVVDRDGRQAPIELNPRTGVVLPETVTRLYPAEVKIITKLLAELTPHCDQFAKENP